MSLLADLSWSALSALGFEGGGALVRHEQNTGAKLVQIHIPVEAAECKVPGNQPLE